MNESRGRNNISLPPIILIIDRIVILNDPKLYGEAKLGAYEQYLDDGFDHSSNEDEEWNVCESFARWSRDH
jgi:hypothetical protein